MVNVGIKVFGSKGGSSEKAGGTKDSIGKIKDIKIIVKV